MAESMGERLQQYMQESGISQAELARRSGVKQQTISYLITTRSGASSYAIKLATALGVNPAWLQDGIGSPLDPMVAVGSGHAATTSRAHWVPKLKTSGVAAFMSGEGDGNSSRIVTAWDVTPGSFGMEVAGRSMAPEFADGDEVIIDVGIKPEPGDLVVAIGTGGDAVLRRYRPRSAAQPLVEFDLVAANADFPAIKCPAQDYKLAGVVVEHRRRLRSG